MSSIGVCVLAYNSEDVLVNCIRALQDALRDGSHEIVIVDNNSADKSAAVVEQHYPELRVIRSPVNSGYARGNNIGARYLLEKGQKYIAFVNPDVTVLHDTLARMLAVLENYRDAGCVGGIAVVHGEPSERSFRTKPTLAQKLWLYSLAKDFPLLRDWFAAMTKSLESEHFVTLSGSAQPVYAVSGACILFPAAVFAHIGGFDEHTFLFQEEFIISERLQRAGYRIYGAPEARYDHLLGHSVRARLLRSQWCFIRSEQYLARAYYGWRLLKRSLVGLVRCVDLVAAAVVAGLNRLHKRFSII